MKLNYKTFGEGKPLIILHGLLGSLDNWQTLARRFSAEFKVYTVDLRNHGKSPHSEVHSYQAMADDLLEFLTHHQIDKAYFIGHSMGGKAAMQFAILHPQRVLKLIVVDIAPRTYESKHEAIFDALMKMDLSKITGREEADAILAETIQDASMRQFLLKNLDRNPDGSFRWKMNLKSLWMNYSNINTPLYSESKIDIPVTVIRGGLSGYVTENDLESFKEIFPHTRLITIPGAGHWVHADAPDAFYEIVRNELVFSKT
ncbi:MAG TPA: alpha/beta fold hydrolase [Chitinophagales bacterium]|nr:alpha/beta fold hydrolase [Chitinophagales bacterium]